MINLIVQLDDLCYSRFHICGDIWVVIIFLRNIVQQYADPNRDAKEEDVFFSSNILLAATETGNTTLDVFWL